LARDSFDVDYNTWEPLYLQILEDFGFSLERDEEAAEHLADLLAGRKTAFHDLCLLVRGNPVAICGNAPHLAAELDDRGSIDSAILAADGAVSVLLERNIVPGAVVTDLDGPFLDIQKANRMGGLVVVHAHGDNLDALTSYVPRLERMVGTCQCRPTPGLFNFGGFTDGDRCVFLAKDLGAAKISLLGFDFQDESVTARKKKKLGWAKKLIDLALSSD
jgi:uncharacterized Rossmann fold enzyme